MTKSFGWVDDGLGVEDGLGDFRCEQVATFRF